MDEPLLDNWSTQIRKGVLELCILNVISAGSLYGYDIVRRLRQLEGLVISEGTIYPILSRFKRDGLVNTHVEESDQGPPRKYYQVTERGRVLLAAMNQYWSIIRQGIDILAPGPTPSQEQTPCPMEPPQCLPNPNSHI